MIVTTNKRVFEVTMGGTMQAPAYYAQTHCWCGSSFGSGEWWPTINRAVKEAEENISEHEAKGKHIEKDPIED